MMLPPMKDTCNRSELRLLQWLEALNKDEECTFGILRGCWRIPKTGICVHNTEVNDNIWMSCCALHNLLLDAVDGLSRKWEEGVPSSYWTDAGQFQDGDIPAAIRCLIDPTGIESHRLQLCESSRFGFRNCNDDDKIENDNRNETNRSVVAIRNFL